MTFRRADQRWFNRGSTPTISQTGRFERSPPGRSANRTPRNVVRWCSSAVLYVSDAATFAACRMRPSIDNHRPPRVCTLFATATWVCRSGSPARESRWVNAAATYPVTLTWLTPPVPSRVSSARASTNRNAAATAA